MPTNHEERAEKLNQILNSDDDSPVEILPDGSVKYSRERNLGSDVLNQIVLGLLPGLEAEAHKRVAQAFALLKERLSQPATPGITTIPT